MNDEELNKTLEYTNFTLKDLLGGRLWTLQTRSRRGRCSNTFYFDATNGNLTCIVRKNETEIYSLFTNDRDSPHNKDFQVLMKFLPSEEDKKVVSKIAEGMEPNTVKRVNLDKIREEVRQESDSGEENQNVQ